MNSVPKSDRYGALELLVGRAVGNGFSLKAFRGSEAIAYLTLVLSGLLLLALLMIPTAAQASDALITRHCVGCHLPESAKTENGMASYSRISHQRKTPEGWLMTIARMEMVHGLNIEDENRRQIIKFLSDKQGLSPQEAEPYRYILEQRLNTAEKKQPELAEMCARCHSEARVGLQRREQKEWRHLVDFHIGQWPSIEYSAMGRDRDWMGIALNEVVPFLGKTQGMASDSWSEWQKRPSVSVAGRWRVSGNAPGRGAFVGWMNVKDTGQDNYAVEMNVEFIDVEFLNRAGGKSETVSEAGSGDAIVYTGYEWRGNITLADVSYRQVLSLGPQGNSLSGRMFLDDDAGIGMDISAHRSGSAQIASVYPQNIKAGAEQILTIFGTGLDGKVSLGRGLDVIEELKRSEEKIVLRVRANAAKQAYQTDIKVGASTLSSGLSVYDKISHIEVLPAYAVARVGGGGGSAKKQKAAYQAMAYAVGPDGARGTQDDVSLGPVQAHWQVSPFDDIAIRDKDMDFAGQMNASTGVFTPSEAGPNPNRKYGTNNAGHLTVTANVKDGSEVVSGIAELIVTVQRWNNPPIR